MFTVTLLLQRTFKLLVPCNNSGHTTNANTDGWGNKLVTIFAPHLDNFVITYKLSLIYKIRDFGSGQIRSTETILSFAGTGKNCAIPSSPPGQIPAKEPGLVAGWLRRVTFTPSTAGPLATRRIGCQRESY